MNIIDSFLDVGNVKFRSCYRDSVYAVIRKNDKTNLLNSMASLFYVSFAIGYHFNKKSKIERNAINHVNLVSLDRSIKELMIRLILKRNQNISEPKDLWKEVEMYAEYGIQVLFDNWKQKNNLDFNQILEKTD